MKSRSSQLQNTLDLLVLRTLAARGPLHGYAIVNHIQTVSDDELRVEEGSLYPALHRMESEGWVDAEWKVSETNRRVKLYRITAAGRKQLAREHESWERLTRAVGKVLRLA
jgi:PadR family transcriptional regulator PadR